MPKFEITETRPAVMTWVFEVEADDEEQALQMVMDGDVSPEDFTTEEEEGTCSEYEITLLEEEE